MQESRYSCSKCFYAPAAIPVSLPGISIQWLTNRVKKLSGLLLIEKVLLLNKLFCSKKLIEERLDSAEDINKKAHP